MAKTYAARAHYEIDANRELVGLGAANLAAGLSSGMVVNGSLSKTAANGSAGAPWRKGHSTMRPGPRGDPACEPADDRRTLTGK